MIFGAIGYSILNNSQIFPNTRIILISDKHDEPSKSCKSLDGTIIPSQIISAYLDKLLKKKYIILLEEIEYDGELVGLWNDSMHVISTRQFYLNCKQNELLKESIVAFDIRLDLINNFDRTFSDKQIFIKYIYNIYKFCILKLEHFNKLKIYNTDTIASKIIQQCYYKILEKFYFFIMTYKLNLYDIIEEIPKKNSNIKISEIYDTIEILLSDIMELYCIVNIFELISKGENKFVIYCGLYHCEKIQKILIDNFKYELYKTNGIMSMDNIHNSDHIICTDVPE